ncbi:MAG: dTDP-4-dehydrorhamnose reductase [Thermoplasmata archaeon]
MEKAAIIGANGQLGSDIVEAFKEGYEVFPLTHGDIEVSEMASVSSVLEKLQPDVIINTAAYHDLKKCEANPGIAFAVNTLGAKNLAQWCKSRGALLVHISTDYVFDGKKRTPYAEEDIPRPVNMYGITKLGGELAIQAIHERHVIVRTGGLYGTHPCRGKPAKNFVEMFLELIRDKEVVEFGGDEVCSPTFTEPLAKQIRKIVDFNVTGIFHVTTKGSCSWFEFGEEIIRQTDSRTRLVKRAKGQAGAQPEIIRPGYTVLENRRIEELGINMMPHWRDALREYLLKRRQTQ